MFWTKLLKTNLKYFKDKLFHPIEYKISNNTILFKKVSDLIFNISHILLNKLNSKEKEILNWITNKKGYIGFESFIVGEYVKNYIEKQYENFIEEWQIEDSQYLVKYFEQYPEEYSKWVDMIKKLYNNFKKISSEELENFIKEHNLMGKLFDENTEIREEYLKKIKKDLWDKTFNYLQFFYIY